MVDAFSMHMVMYRDTTTVTAHHFFVISLSLLYGVRCNCRFIQYSLNLLHLQIVASFGSYFVVLAQFRTEEQRIH